LQAYSIKTKLILTLLCTALVTPAGLLAYFLLFDNQVAKEKERVSIRQSHEEKVFFFEENLHHTYSDIRFISQLVQRALAKPADKNILDINNADISFVLEQFLDSNPHYQQIRLINDQGYELIRFDQRHENITRTELSNLQDKSKYNYFKESIKLSAGGIYISKLDLNRESGVIEVPHNPTLRFAIKLELKQTGFNGIIVVNISAQHLLDDINNRTERAVYLVDKKGNYILHPQKEKQWSAALGTPHNISSDYPKFNQWQDKLQRDKYALFSNGQQLHISLIDSGSQFHRQWFLITAVPLLDIWDSIQQQLTLIFSVLFGIFFSILFGSYFSNHWIITPINYMKTISEKLVKGESINLKETCQQKDEIGSLCQKLNQMAKIISTSREEKECDIQLLKKSEQDLRIYKALFEATSEAMLITDDNEIITHINPAYTKIMGFSKQDALGKTPRINSSGKQDTFFYENIWQQLKTLGSWQGEIFNKRKNGEIITVQQNINAINVDDKTTHYVVVFSDITHLKAQEKKLKQHAHYDSLTGLANRELMQDRINQTIAQLHRHEGHAALLFMDIDNFKHINDSLGHYCGDQLLKIVAERLKEQFRKIDTVSRFGGDEFTILITDLPADETATRQKIKKIVSKLLTILEKPYFVNKHELYFSSSIGICIFPILDNHTTEEVIKMADIAMYAAKNDGKSTYRFYHADMQEKAHQRLLVEKGLRNAMKDNQLILFYQCQCTSEKELLGVEALIRWQHPEQGLIFPNDFIPIAEETGLIVEIGEIVIRQACLQMKQWEKEGHTIPHISVNVSPKQFAEKNFVDKVCAICKETKIPSEQLVLELTEASIINNIESTIEKMSQLRALGYRVSIDDFGTGYSSLAYLKQLPISQLKIDKTFIDDINQENEEAAIVDTIISMAQHLKLDIIAEGVENQYQVDYLRSHGCMGYQGYYFCKPVPSSEVFKNNIKQGELCYQSKT